MNASHFRFTLMGYTAGSLGASISINLAPLFMLYFLTEHAHLSPWLAGAALALPKLWDVLVDAPIGRVTDVLARRTGERYTMIMYSAIAVVMLLPLSFLKPPIDSPIVLASYYIVIQIGQATAFTTFGVNFLALANEISAEGNHRNAYVAANNLGNVLSGLAILVSAPLLIKAGGGGLHGYLTMTLAIAAFAAVMLAWGWSIARRAPAVPMTPEQEQNHHPFVTAVRDAVSNRTFACLLSIMVTTGITSGCLNSLLPYGNSWLLQRPAEQLLMLAAPSTLASILGIPLSVLMIRKLGLVPLLRISIACSAAGLAIQWLGMLVASNAVIVLGGALVGMTAAFVFVCVQAGTLDIVGSRQTKASSGVFLGLLLSAQKLGMSLGVALGGGALSAIHYHPGVVVDATLRHAFAIVLLITPLTPLLVASGASWFVRRPQSVAHV